MKGADYRIDNVYDTEPNSELWDNVLTKNFEKRVPVRTVYVWFVNDEENSERLEINKR